MTLRDDILANAACDAARTTKDCQSIADIMSANRTKRNTREIGNGTILETLGITTGNTLLDFLLDSSPTSTFRHVKPLIEQGRLLIGSPLVQATVQSFVPAVLTLAQADALCALGIDPNPYTVQEVADALFNPDGSSK